MRKRERVKREALVGACTGGDSFTGERLKAGGAVVVGVAGVLHVAVDVVVSV